jgi:predicted permease
MSAGTIINGMQWEGNRGWYWFGAVVRLAPDVDVAAAEEEATALHRNGRRDMIEQDRYPAEASIALDPLIAARGPEASGESRVARWLGGVSLLVLLIACANVANLLLARGTRRRRELAVRLALGVGRGRLVSTMVVECILLALLGGAVALVVALWAGGVVRGTLLPGVYFPGSAVGGRVLLFAGAAALLAGVLAGFAPALQATRADLAGDLAMGAGVGSTRRSRTRAALTILQGALSVVLLVGAGLFVRSASRVHDLDLGLDVDRLVVATLEFEGDGTFLGTRADALPDVSEEQARNDIYRAAMERVLHEPGVEAATTTSSPFGWAFATSLEVPGLDSIPRLAGGGPYFQDVTPEYLRTVGLRVTRGRDLAESDAHGTPPVTMVSETMARTLWPDEDPLGKCMLVGDGATRCTTVVGVVEDASRGSLEEDPYMAYYMPLAQRDGRQANALYLRVSGDASEVAARVAPILRGIDPRVRFASVTPLREQLDPQARAWTLGAMMFSVFGALALIVAAIGLYGVLAFDIAQRTRELGIRAALGAERGRLLRSVVAAGVRLGAAGVTLGLLVAWFAGRFASDLLFHTSPHDPQVLIGVAGALLAVSIAASFVPGVRATHIDPSEALRVE